MVVEVHVVCWRKFFYPKKQYKINQKILHIIFRPDFYAGRFYLKMSRLEDIDTFNL